ncbi:MULTISPECIES: DUF3618 domain-containing protein [unclassified Frankia]
MTSTSPDEIRSDIEATRARLGSDLDQLSDRVSPQKVAGRTAQDIKRRVTTATEAVRPKVAATTEIAAEKARDTADQAKATVRRQFDAHPQLAVTAQKARATAGSAAGTATQTVHKQIEAHPQVAAKAGQVRDTAGSALTAGRQKAADNPRAAGSAAGLAVLLVILLLILRLRRHCEIDPD